MKRAKDQLKTLEVRPSKSRGQNFIIQEGILALISDFGKPQAATHLLEIGPGLGSLTAEILRFEKPLAVVEIEPAFCADLKQRFPQIEIYNEDARTFDFSKLEHKVVVFGNLPYSYSTEILFHLIDSAKYIERAVLMLQREFAERVAASPGGRDYGVLSVNAQLSAEMRLGPIIEGNAFHPPTQVQSRLLELTFLKEPKVKIEDIAWFKRVVKGSFSQRRRKLLNSLSGASLVDKQFVKPALIDAGIDPGRRAETLSIAEFSKLALELAKYKGAVS